MLLQTNILIAVGHMAEWTSHSHSRNSTVDSLKRPCGLPGAVSLNCTASGNATGSSNSTVRGTFSDPCLPAVYVGFAGSDKRHRTFQSGYQITKINQFSLVAFYQRAASTVRLIHISTAHQTQTSKNRRSCMAPAFIIRIPN